MGAIPYTPVAVRWTAPQEAERPSTARHRSADLQETTSASGPARGAARCCRRLATLQGVMRDARYRRPPRGAARPHMPTQVNKCCSRDGRPPQRCPHWDRYLCSLQPGVALGVAAAVPQLLWGPSLEPARLGPAAARRSRPRGTSLRRAERRGGFFLPALPGASSANRCQELLWAVQWAQRPARRSRPLAISSGLASRSACAVRGSERRCSAVVRFVLRQTFPIPPQWTGTCVCKHKALVTAFWKASLRPGSAALIAPGAPRWAGRALRGAGNSRLFPVTAAVRAATGWERSSLQLGSWFKSTLLPQSCFLAFQQQVWVCCWPTYCLQSKAVPSHFEQP